MNRSRDPKHYFQKKTPRPEPAYPLATVFYYGPDESTATKAVLSIVMAEGNPPAIRKQWLSGELDAREDPSINRQILEALNEHGAAKLALVDRIAGCPHEAGVDYPRGQDCPFCPFWAKKV